MNYQVVDQAFLSQLKGSGVEQVTRVSNAKTSTRNSAVPQSSMFDFVSVAKGPAGSKHLPSGQVSQSTRHAGKNVDRLNFNSFNQPESQLGNAVG